MNILIVDDREYDALELHSKLAAVCPSANVTWRSSPDRALEEIKSRDADPYDVVLVDQHMPGGLGTDFVKRIGRKLNRKATRIILLTSDGCDSTRARALVSECDGFLTKPVDTTRLSEFLDGSKCYWELSDLPTNLDHYRKLLGSHESDLCEAVG